MQDEKRVLKRPPKPGDVYIPDPVEFVVDRVTADGSIVLVTAQGSTLTCPPHVWRQWTHRGHDAS